MSEPETQIQFHEDKKKRWPLTLFTSLCDQRSLLSLLKSATRERLFGVRVTFVRLHVVLLRPTCHTLTFIAGLKKTLSRLSMYVNVWMHVGDVQGEVKWNALLWLAETFLPVLWWRLMEADGAQDNTDV